MAQRYGALTLQLKNLSDLSNIGSTHTNIFSASGKQVLSGVGSGSFSYSARDNTLHTAVKAADGQVAYIYQTDAVASGAAMDVCCIIIDGRNITTSPDGATVTVSGSDILDQLTFTNAGTGAIDDGSGGPSSTDLDDIMTFAAAGWSYTATGTGSSTRSSTGSYHATKGDNVLQLLVATAKRSGDIFRLSSYSPPAKTVAWRASADSSGVTLRMPTDTTAYDGSTTTGIILNMTEETDVSERITGVRPFGAGIGDGRLDITGITSSNTGGDPSGYSTTFENNVIVNDTLETALGYTKRIDVDFSDIGVEDGTNATQLTSAAVDLWREAINFLQERDGAKTFYRVRCIVPYDLRPGQTVAINYTEYEGGTTGGSAVWTVNSSFTIHEVTNSVGQDGLRYTDLQVADTIKKQATADRVMAAAVQKTQATTRKSNVSTSPGSVPDSRTLNATQPVRIDGGAAADLSADRTLSINGLSTVGSANQIPGTNSGGTAWEYKTVSGGVTHSAGSIAVHAQSHVLATNAGLGSDHTISGATSGHVLRASGATTAAFAQLQHSDLGGVTANQHHNQSHVLASTSGLGADHTVSGLTSGQVLRATGATTAAFGSLQATDLPSHVLATNTALGSQHTISGATSGHVLRASSATAANFQQLSHSDLGGVTANQHHNQSHVLASTSGLGADHTVSGLTARQVLVATGATTALFRAIETADLPTGATLSVSSTNSGNSHAITSSSAVSSATAVILATDASGRVQVEGLGIGTAAGASDAITMADDAWIGLGSSAARIVFDNQTVDQIELLDATVIVGSQTPDTNLIDSAILQSVDGNIAITRSGNVAHIAIYSYFIPSVGQTGTAVQGRQARGTRSSPTATQSGDYIARFGGGGYDGSNFADASRAFVQVVAGQNYTPSNQGTHLLFFATPNDSTTPARVVTVENAAGYANVGIGTGTTGLVGLGPALTIEDTVNNGHLEFSLKSNSIADNANIGTIDWFAGSTTQTRVAAITGKVAGTAENAGEITFFTKTAAGGLSEVWRIHDSGGLVGNSATGGDKGAGTINISADIYKNNTAYTNPDYALEAWRDGRIVQHAHKPGARDYRRLTLGEVEEHIRANLRLPGFNDKPAGMFQRGDLLLEKVEELFTHLIELNHKVEAING